jgi:xylitol oxidase
LRSRYERMTGFIELATKYDPKAKFRNDFLNTYVFAS